GVQFVVVAWLSEATALPSGQEEMQAFSTPQVVHFSSVLLLSAICSTPHQTETSLAICLIGCGLVAMIYQTTVILNTKRSPNYQPVFEDWLFHAILPAAAYITVFVAGICETRALAGPLYAVGIAALILLFVGIHNAWDTS